MDHIYHCLWFGMVTVMVGAGISYIIIDVCQTLTSKGHYRVKYTVVCGVSDAGCSVSRPETTFA